MFPTGGCTLNTSLGAGGYLRVGLGGLANSAVVTSSGAKLDIEGTANNISAGSAAVNVSITVKGFVGRTTLAASGGVMNVLQQGNVSAVSVFSSSLINISSGGSANYLSVGSRGSAVIHDGGNGDDTIWGGAASNVLFGDEGNDSLIGASGSDLIAGGSGNDTMHGGGGNDIFTFGGAWGNDTGVQLAGGSVTLWFESGSNANWNEAAMTYSDGVNCVTVTGTQNVTLKFGSIAESGIEEAFDDSVSGKIFEDKALLA